MFSDDTAGAGWEWAHDFVLGMVEDRNPEVEMTREAAFDIAAAAVLVAYRAGLREGYIRAGVTPPIEEPYSDSDLTEQMRRYDAAFAERYGFVRAEDRSSSLGYLRKVGL